MTKLSCWLVGENPKTITLIVAGLVGLSFGLLVMYLYSSQVWTQIILFILSFDIAAGLISNLSQSTRAFWTSQSSLLKGTYIVLHVFVYPIMLWLLTGWSVLFLIVLIPLAAKILAFSIGIKGVRKN